MSVLEEGNLPTIHGPFATGNEHVIVNGSIYRMEITGASDTRKNSPAVQSVPRLHTWRSASTTK